MEIGHPNRDIWTSVSEEVRDRRYGSGFEYDEDDLREDLEGEETILDDDELDEAYDELLDEMPVTGEDIERKLKEYSPV